MILTHFDNGLHLEYNTGRFDDWCIYLVGQKNFCKAPKDVEYFTNLLKYSKIYRSR